jgi:hypothetical protein
MFSSFNIHLVQIIGQEEAENRINETTKEKSEKKKRMKQYYNNELIKFSKIIAQF